MEFQRITSPSLKKLFVDQIERMILSGSLAVGEKLPPERELAEQMGVSRPVVNAGLADMASKGFLEIRPRKGVFVADYSRTGSLDTLISIMEYNGGMLPRREVRSLIEIHQVIMELSLRKAVPGMTNDGIAALQGHVDRLLASDTPEEAAEHCYAFDHEMDCQSDNVITPLLTHSFKQPCISLWTAYGRKNGIDALKKHRAALLEFVKGRDAEGAVAFLREVFDDAIEGGTQIYGER